ncbi:MAG TPA: class I SAM-dependent methyltransferase [Flavobacterium sp.]
MDRTKNAVEVFDKRATEYQDKFMDVSLYHECFDKFCDAISETKGDILDIACGPGNVSKYLLQQRPDYRIMGIDLSSRMIALAQVNNPTAKFEVMDCRNMRSLGSRFHGIVCAFVLPYLSKEATGKLIADTYELLLDGGVIYISTMEDAYEKSKMVTSSYGDKIFMYFHDLNYLNQALVDSCFEILETRRQTYPTTDGTSVVDLIIIAKKKGETINTVAPPN